MSRLCMPRHVAALAWVACVLPIGAGAQTTVTPAAAVPTPAELAPRRIEIGTDPKLLPPAPVAPRRLSRPDDDVKLKVVRFELPESAPAALRAALPTLLASYVGSDRSFGDLTGAAREVTRYLQSELGYYLGLAYVPEQDAQDGVIRLAILEGRLDRVELVWPPGMQVGQQVVEEYLAQIPRGSVLMARDVERMVFLLNDLRGLAAEFEVVPGAEPGTARFIVRPKNTPRVGWSAELDNANAEDLGRYRATGTVSYNNPFGRGDSATASLVAAEGLAFLLGSYTLPVNASGLRIGAAISALKYKVVKGAFADSGIQGTATTASLFTLYPWVRSRAFNLFASASLDAKDYSDETSVTTNKKRITTLSAGLTGDLRDTLIGNGLNSLDAQLVAGQVKFDVPPTVNAPSDRFSKLTLRAVRLQSLPSDSFQLYAAVRAQWAFDNLDVTEQFRTGGPDGVRAFSAGQGSGDSGVLGTLELRYLPPEQWLAGNVNGRASVALFVDGARVQLRQDASGVLTAGYVNYETYAGAGLALQWDGPDGWSLRASVASQFEAPRNPDGTFRFERSPRFFAQVRKQF